MRPGLPLLRALMGRRRGGGGGTPTVQEITGIAAAQFSGLTALGYGTGTGIAGTAAGVFPGLVASGGTTVGQARSRLATNIPGPTYWDSCVQALDLGTQRSDWGYGGGGSIPLDAMGWPTQVVAGSGQYAGWQARILYPGQYVALYQGVGTLAVEFGGSVVSSVNGRYVLQLDGVNSGDLINRVAIVITSSSASNPVRNLVVVPIENENNYQTQLFHQRYLDTLAPFGVLRMLDVQRINNQERLNGWPDMTVDTSQLVTSWATRTPGGHALQARRQGTSIEYMVDMCRRANSHLWFQVPLFATTNWCDGMAALLASYAPSWMEFYFDYGNEQWNDAFFNGYDAHQLGISRYGLPDEYDTRFAYQAIMGRYMKQALLNAGIAASRVHYVLETQVGFVLRNEILRDYQYTQGLFTDGSRAWQHAEFMAVAPYFSHGRGEEPSTLSNTIPQVIAAMAAEDVPVAISDYALSVAAAQVRGLKMACYESGQHLYNSDFGNTAMQTRLNEINRHTDMYQLSYDYLDDIRDATPSAMRGPVTLYHHCGDYSQWGRWGWMEDLRQTIGATPRQCPKMDAAVDWGIANAV